MGKKYQTQKAQTYVVEDIVDIRLYNGVQQFKVKWKGYPMSACTWQTQESFKCPRATLDNFLKVRADMSKDFKAKLLDIDAKLSKNKSTEIPKQRKIPNSLKLQDKKVQIETKQEKIKASVKQQQQFLKIEIKKPSHIKILSVEKKQKDLAFLVIDVDGTKKFMSKNQMHQFHAVDLCLFYQEHLSFD